MKNIRDFKDKAILFVWITGILMFISVLWIITQPVQTHYLLRTVNSVFVSNDDPRRLLSYMNYKGGNKGLFGYWYLMYNSTDQMFIFTVFQNGILLPLGAVVTADGEVEEVIPLSAHAAQTFNNIPDSILNIYIRRIEDAALLNMEGTR
jgi:hypothetical protein